MTFKMMTAFAAILAVGTVSASLLGDLCYDACIPQEQQAAQCRAGCSPTGRKDGSVTESCSQNCAEIAAPCNMFCFANYRSCLTTCELYMADRYNCLTTCIQEAFVDSQTSSETKK